MPRKRGHRVKTLAEFLSRPGCSQSKLASDLGVAPSTISKIVKGTRTPSLRLAARIEQLTGVPSARLIGTVAA